MNHPITNFGHGASPVTEAIPKGKIDFENLFLHSNLAAYIAKSCICGSIAAVPIVAGTLGVALPPLAGIAFIVAAVALPIIMAVMNPKPLLHDISLIYTVLSKNAWWSKIDDNVILGAMPLEHHLQTLTELGITHVLIMVDNFELEAGVVRPITSKQWQQAKVIRKHISTPDFLGISPGNIHEGVLFVEAVRQEKGIVFIHCKAGRGRSATIAIADRMKQCITNETTRSFLTDQKIWQLLADTIAEIKKIYPDINLNKNQQKPIIEYVKQHVLKKKTS